MNKRQHIKCVAVAPLVHLSGATSVCTKFCKLSIFLILIWFDNLSGTVVLSISLISPTGGSVIQLASHHDLRLIRRIGEGRRAGVEMWSAMLSSSGGKGRCHHRVAVKKVMIGEDTDLVWVQSQLENLRRASMWCRNVCTFHGATRVEDGCLSLIMDRCNGSVLTEMQRNEGRLTLEQILRYSSLIFLS